MDQEAFERFKQTNVRKMIKFHASLGQIMMLQKRGSSKPKGRERGRRIR
jgi:hypothetical protein